MKCLIKLNDQEKVIAFANNARISEIYILAGNYLQTSDWHKSSDLMKHIIGFYNKAKAFDHLAGGIKFLMKRVLRCLLNG